MRQQSGDASLLRRLNSAAILRVLRESEVATLSELARAARVSRPTAEVIVEDLLAEGWAEECAEGQDDRRRGRPARRFRFRAGAGHVVGVGVGGSRLRAMVTDLNGAVVAARRASHHPSMPAGDRLDAIAELVGAVLAEAGPAVRDVTAVGVGTTGTVDGSGRVVKSVALAGWTGLDLRGELSRRIQAPVLVDNDMRLAVLAEHWRGQARGRQDVVYLFTGSRLGLGLLIGGRPHRGAHAASGEIGRQAGDHWRAYRHMTEYAIAVEPGELRSQREAAQFAIERARAGDEQAARAVGDFARQLGQGLLTVVNPLDPELVVIGGSLSQAGDLLVEPIRKLFSEACLYPPDVAASGLGGECVALGAVRLALDHADRRLFTQPS
ncbi:ROK family protein [Nonomuraea gerenzanensis]|uniref:Transcriptional regulatory protein n=1 Tax=Nonomuraea gerenzanensis TaxID=93944 RepID=A0A1M4ER79_9ACTN|nr:ROK family protein [Nonomuraea gerenzanensis]UBU12769.1 ROK family protein [Nonomuraea gerenzanensis]SBP01325.1 transcriptional regulatory protein [Nonomuraea gerenzanensis]